MTNDVKLPEEVIGALRALALEVHPDIVKHLTGVIEAGFAQELTAIASKSAEVERQRILQAVRKLENIYRDEFDEVRKISFGRHMAFEDCREAVADILGEKWGMKAIEALSQKESL